MRRCRRADNRALGVIVLALPPSVHFRARVSQVVIRIRYRLRNVAGRFRLRDFDAQPVSFCCASMTASWGNVVEMGLHGYPIGCNVRPLILTAAYPLSDGEVGYTVTPLDWCPWCGERLEPVDGGIDTSPEEPARHNNRVADLNF